MTKNYTVATIDYLADGNDGRHSLYQTRISVKCPDGIDIARTVPRLRKATDSCRQERLPLNWTDVSPLFRHPTGNKKMKRE